MPSSIKQRDKAWHQQQKLQLKIYLKAARILATKGTAARIRDAGFPVKTVNKVLEGRPHCVDAIRSGEIQLVINTASTPQSVADSFEIRRSALTHQVPHYTTIAGARAAVHAIAALKTGTLEVAPLQSYFRGSF